MRLVNDAVTMGSEWSIVSHVTTVIAIDLVPITPYNVIFLAIELGKQHSCQPLRSSLVTRRYDAVVIVDQPPCQRSSSAYNDPKSLAPIATVWTISNASSVEAVNLTGTTTGYERTSLYISHMSGRHRLKDSRSTIGR